MGVCMIDLYTEICKPTLKLDFTAQDQLESLSEYGVIKYHVAIKTGFRRKWPLSRQFYK